VCATVSLQKDEVPVGDMLGLNIKVFEYKTKFSFDCTREREMVYVSTSATIELKPNGDTFFECPFCWTNYNKRNGNPTKNASAKCHSIKSFMERFPDNVKVHNNNVTVVIEAANVPCDVDRFPKDKDGFMITFG